MINIAGDKVIEKIYEYMELEKYTINGDTWLVRLNKLGKEGWRVQSTNVTPLLLEREYIPLSEFRDQRINKILN